MCGIVGSFGYNGQSISEASVRRGMERIKHRGPDDEGLVTLLTEKGTLHLGHTRLSILDLSSLGKQPMASEDGRFYLSFNGEVYNYKELRTELRQFGYEFKSDSDTEVLLQAWRCWGSSCVKKLTGMFAFTMFDKELETITCVRDAFGIKPFFYFLNENKFSFASEIRSLLELLDSKPELNIQKAYDFLLYAEYDRDEKTFFEDIYRLLPGHLMTLSLKEDRINPEISQWWVPSILERRDLSFSDAAEELRDRFLQNIRLHLRSDVPLGAALSGGVDSSALVCGMRYVEPDMPIHTFSYTARGSNLDEEKWADLVNDRVGAIPHKIVVKPEELINDIKTLISVQGEPFSTTNMYAQFRVFQLARENGITVMLNGQGADEMLAGYDGYPELKVESLMSSHQYGDLLTFLKHWPNSDQRNKHRIYRSIIKSLTPSAIWRKMRQKKHSAVNLSWIDKDWFREQGVMINGDSILTESESANRKVMERLSVELSQEKIPRLLRYEDRNSMHWSIESRVPFLTTDLAQFLLSLPEDYLISNRGETKHVFKEAMKGIVPDPILQRKDKIGFDTPGQDWLSGLEPQLDSILSPLHDAPFLNVTQCRERVSSMIRGGGNFSWDAWRLICFAGWMDVYEMSISN